jgi:hypothetical protein
LWKYLNKYIRWPGWSAIPVRKPLAVLAGTGALALSALSFLSGRDIPVETSKLLQTLVTVCIGAYTASSVLEAGVGQNHDKNDSENVKSGQSDESQ